MQLGPAGVIINPGSGRGNGKGKALRDALAGKPNVHVVFLDTFQQLQPALVEIARRGVHTVFVSSGDGTVQALQSFIAESGHFAIAPRLCILPHGTTNMTAADLGFQRKTIAEQAAFIINPIPQTLAQRSAIRVLDAADGRIRQGMFLGTGAVADATRQCQVSFNDRGVRGNGAAFATLARAVAKAVFSAPDPSDRSRLDRPFPISCELDGKPFCEGPRLLLLATTLSKLVMGVRPFWGNTKLPVRVTSFPYPLPRPVLRWVYPAARGGEDRTPPPGSLSAGATRGVINSTGSFVIDGEFFMPPENGNVRFELGRTFTFILS